MTLSPPPWSITGRRASWTTRRCRCRWSGSGTRAWLPPPCASRVGRSDQFAAFSIGNPAWLPPPGAFRVGRRCCIPQGYGWDGLPCLGYFWPLLPDPPCLPTSRLLPVMLILGYIVSHLTNQSSCPLSRSYAGKVATDLAGGRLFISDSSNNRIVVTDLKGKFIEHVSVLALPCFPLPCFPESAGNTGLHWPTVPVRPLVPQAAAHILSSRSPGPWPPPLQIGCGAPGLVDGSYEEAAFYRPQGVAYSPKVGGGRKGRGREGRGRAEGERAEG